MAGMEWNNQGQRSKRKLLLQLKVLFIERTIEVLKLSTYCGDVLSQLSSNKG